jgi:hypothetical protein
MRSALFCDGQLFWGITLSCFIKCVIARPDPINSAGWKNIYKLWLEESTPEKLKGEDG